MKQFIIINIPVDGDIILNLSQITHIETDLQNRQQSFVNTLERQYTVKETLTELRRRLADSVIGLPKP